MFDINNVHFKSRNDRGAFSLSTGLDNDFACFILWSRALKKEEEILKDIRSKFDLLGSFLIFWSDEKYDENIRRLYERGIYERVAGVGPSGYSDKIGEPPFRLVIVRDPSPTYTWKKSTSGTIEPSNERVISAKKRYRSKFDKAFQVHSSSNIEEFVCQSSLLLGVDLLSEVLESSHVISKTLHKDLEGANGWESWQDLFEILNVSVPYIVLRNFERLPEELQDSDIDFLCRDFQRFASVANVLQRRSHPYKGKLRVGEKPIPTDIRFVGDGYYYNIWQESMLSSERKKMAFLSRQWMITSFPFCITQKYTSLM